MSKISTTFALVTLAALLLSTMAISSTSASSKDLSNSGNIINTHQNCVAGTSCNLSSSNVINREPASTTSSAASTELMLGAVQGNSTQRELIGALLCFSTTECGNSDRVPAPVTITFTGTGVPSNLATTLEDGFFLLFFEAPTTPGTYTVQAHFAGTSDFLPSDSQVQQFTIT